MDGKKLKLAIKGSGLSMEKAAEKMGISRTTLYSYFTMASVPLEALQNVRTKLDIELSEPITHTSTLSSDDTTRKYVALLERNESRSIEIAEAAADSAVKAAFELMAANYATKKDVEDLAASLSETQKDVVGHRKLLEALQVYLVNRFADEDEVDRLDFGKQMSRELMQPGTQQRNSKKGAVGKTHTA